MHLLSLDIRIFLQKAETDATIVGQYLKNGGKPLELAQTMNKVDKDELFHISYIFSALHLVLMEKMNQTNKSNTDAIETCAYMLNNHRSSIEKLLASNYATHKKSILKFLTDAVYLAPHLARELLTTFDVVFNSETLLKFTAHERNECNLADAERVRTCYIYFVLAFIIEGNHMLIKNLLDRNDLLKSLFSGLMYDSKEIVLLVLNSILKYVLQSGSVTKTKKVQVFKRNVVVELLRLFEWKGPAYFAASSNKKTKDKASQYIDSDDLNTVCDTVYQFLCELLASRKNGIAFKCLSQRRTKVNRVQKKVLLSMDNFVGHSHKTNLIIEVLKACPEITKKFIQKNAPYLDTFKKNSNWSGFIEFFAKLINEMSPNIIQYQVNRMSVKETVELIKEICMAPEILQQLRSKNTIKSSNLNIRSKSTNLLYVMFKQCDQYLLSLTKWNVYRTNEMKKMKFDMINHILLLCPSVENILLSLHMTQIDESAKNEEMFEHLECILDLLLIITKSIPSFIDTTSSVINYIKILGPIYELNREHESSTQIEFKAVKLMLALEPKALSPKTELFDQIIQSFFNVYRFGSRIEQNEAKHLLRTVFYNTGLFENGTLEIDLWLTAINHIDEDSLTTVREFLVKRINSFDINDPNIIRMQTTEMPETLGKNVTEIFQNIEKGTTLKGILDVAMLRPFFLYAIQSFQQLSDDASMHKKHSVDDDDADDVKNVILKYIETVAFYMFHYLPISESVFYAIDSIPHKFSSYMKKWIVQSKYGKLPKDSSLNIFGKFYLSLIENQGNTFASIFDEDLTAIEETTDVSDSVVVNFNGIEYKLSSILADETQIMIFIYTMMFVTNQYHKNHSLTTDNCNQMVNYFTDLIKILEKITVNEISESGFELNDPNGNPLIRALKYIFINCYFLLQSFDIWSKNNQITRLVYEMVKCVEQTEQLNEILVHYRKKISSQIACAVNSSEIKYEHFDNLIDLLKIFHLDAENCCEYLTSLSELSYQHFVTPQNETSIYAGILTYGLHRLAELKECALPATTITKISSLYMRLVRETNVEINYQIIEEAIATYLSVFNHQIAVIHEDFFDSIFEAKRLNKSAVKLACLILDRKIDLIERLPKLIETNMSKKELIYPLINVIATRNLNLDAKLLNKLYGEYKNGIMKTVEKPQKAAVIYKENVLSSVYLIEKCMPIKECTDFLKKIINCDTSDVFQLQIIKSIHLKVLMHSENIDAIEQAYENFLFTFIRLFGTLLSHEPLDFKKLNDFAYIAYDWTKLKLKLLPQALSSKLSYSNIREEQMWLLFCKSCLKYGLKLQKDDKNKDYKDDAAVLLKIVAYLCNEIYENDGNSDDIKTIHEMTITHPNFFDIITMQQHKSALKTNLAYLLYVLTRKNPEIIDSTHIPILLSGYQAKMSHCDQYILAILQLFEKNGCDTYKYRPFIFGESALSHYSLASSVNNTIKATLLQEPPMMQVISLIDVDTAENTLINFPVWRQLNVIEQIPCIEFHCNGIAGEVYSNNVTIAKNNIEKLVEIDEKKIPPNILAESSRRDETFENVYDPAFLIPLMQMAFAPETLTKPLRPSQNGLLAITFACLSSTDKNMRLAAAAAIQRYRSHMECTRFVDNKLWIHVFDGIKHGIQSLTLEVQKRKNNRIPRIPYIAGIFYARTINILMNPLNELYRPLSTYLLIKNSFDFVTVPEFNVLFHSPDVNHTIHRNFILDVLRDGLKTNNDFNILLSNHIFKALFGYYGSTGSTRERNLQILTVINAAVKIPKSTKHMIGIVGIIPWLSSIIDNIEFFHFDFLDLLCTILNNLYNSVLINRIDYGANTLNSIEIQLLRLLLKICPNLSQRIAEISFARYLNVLKAIVLNTNRAQFFNEQNINHLIKCMTGYVNIDLIWDFNNLMENETASIHCERKSDYNHKLREIVDLSEQQIFMLSSLREIIIRWNQVKHPNVD